MHFQHMGWFLARWNWHYWNGNNNSNLFSIQGEVSRIKPEFTLKLWTESQDSNGNPYGS